MSAKYISSNWRLLNQENSSKSDNYGLTFDGTEFIDLNDGDTINGKTSVSISFWVNITTPTIYDGIVCTRNGNDYLLIYLDLISGDDFVISVQQRAASGGSYSLTYSPTLTKGNWYNVTCTGTTGSKWDLYINGSNSGQTQGNAITSFAQSANFLIGSDSQLGGRFTIGKISSVSIFDYALSESQISTLYGSSSLGAGNPMVLNPVAYYPLGDNSASNPLTQPNEAVEDASVFDFDGVNDYVSTPQINLGSTNSISFWINRTSTNQGTLFGDPNATSKYALFTTPSSNQIYFRLGNGDSGYWELTVSSGILNDGNWHHHCLTRNGVTLNYYIDGVLQTNVTTNTLNESAGTNTTIENIFVRSDILLPLSGQLSNAQIWQAELSASEVTTLYNSGVPLLTGTQPQASNLKAWYKLDQSANWEADSSGAWQIPDAVSAYPQSFNFDGSDYVNGGNSTELQIADNLTISAWFKILNNSGNRVIVARDTGQTQRNWGLYVQGTTGLVSLLLRNNTDTGWNQVISSSAYDDGKWHHVAFVYTPSISLILYIDGIAVDTNTTSITPSINNETADFTIGAYSPNQGYTGDRWTGEISNVQCWNSSLPATGSNSVETLYNNGVPLTTAIASDNLKGWWKLDNTATFSTNWSIPDASENGNTGTSSGMTEQNLVNNNVSALNGESSGMTSANLVLSDLTRAVPYDSYSFNFDSASSDYIDCGDSDTFSFGNGSTDSPFSVSFWLNFASFPTTFFAIIAKDFNSTTREWGIGALSTSNKLRFFLKNNGGGSQQSIDSTTTFSTNQWYNVTCCYNGVGGGNAADGMKIYINGIAETPTNITKQTYTAMANTTAPLTIGTYQAGGSPLPFNGKISNVSIFNEELTSTEVLKLYANGVPQDLSSFTPAPVAWWTLGSNSFFNGSNYICRDLIGSNDGTSANAGVDAVVGDSPRSSANGTGTNMDVPSNLEGSTKYSSNNSWSINMSSEARVEDTP